MNAQLLVPGTLQGVDVFIGTIIVAGVKKGILLPPKTLRQYPESIEYNENGSLEGATSWNDGLTNTRDMAKAGSKLAQWALDNNMHIPSMDELEMIYRVCKPTTRANSLYARSGINLSALHPTYPYTADSPAQTTLEEFKEGGPEAFDTDDWYWSSTRDADDEDYAWVQRFGSGDQGCDNVGDTGLGCAVRWIDL